MNVDPLQDTVPPRYAVESDEEDEYNPLESPSKAEPISLEINIIGNVPASQPLILASGDAGKFWARGADLGEQAGGVYVNKIQVGLVFTPKWSKSTIVVSEVTTRLPIWVMDAYAKKIVQELKPTSVSILDTYPGPTYISQEPIPFYAAPVRYLSTGKVSSEVASQTHKFSPPNLISTTSASILSDISVFSPSISAVAVLLPAPHIPPPLPKQLSSSNLPSVHDDTTSWPNETMDMVHRLLYSVNGQALDRHWENKKKGLTLTIKEGRRGDVGEGGMYI